MGANKPNPEVGTNVPSQDLVACDDLITRYNELNKLIVHGLPEIARAYDALARHLPLLRQMQALLSQRPNQAHGGGAEFTMLHRVMGKTVRMATPAMHRNELPTWTLWITAYAQAIDYSVRHIRRLMMNERRTKTVKECGWSQTDHNNLIRAATLAFDLVNAIEHRADTVALIAEVKEIMSSVPEDILDKPYEPRRVRARRRRARLVTE
jgi:hypothetical protein